MANVCCSQFDTAAALHAGCDRSSSHWYAPHHAMHVTLQTVAFESMRCWTITAPHALCSLLRSFATEAAQTVCCVNALSIPCAATMRSTHQLSETKLDASTMTPNVLSANLGKRWRAERNFWISFITFTLWWCAPCQSSANQTAWCGSPISLLSVASC